MGWIPWIVYCSAIVVGAICIELPVLTSLIRRHLLRSLLFTLHLPENLQEPLLHSITCAKRRGMLCVDHGVGLSVPIPSSLISTFEFIRKGRAYDVVGGSVYEVPRELHYMYYAGSSSTINNKLSMF